MRLKRTAASSIAALALALAGAARAGAATEFGDSCAGLSAAPAYTLITLEAPPAALPLTAPTGGVVTKVKVNNSIEIPISIPTAVKVLRPAGGNNYTVIGQQSVTANPGVTTADARIPVQAGDKLGLRGEPFVYEGTPTSASLYCAGAPGVLGAVAGDVPVGSTGTFLAATTARVPLAAVIEPDADGDGYGDETQDKCPQSAAVQAECPLVVLDAYPVPGKNKVVVLVSVNNETSVTVSGSVKLPKAATSASASAAAKLKKVTRKVTPGKIGRFTLKFPGSLKQALGDLPAGKKLKLKITASAKNVAGQVSKDKTTLKLKGA
jgi:hypothetical protein